MPEGNYLCTVKDMKVVPNDYYLDLKPVKPTHPLSNWTYKRKRKIEEEKLACSVEAPYFVSRQV